MNVNIYSYILYVYIKIIYILIIIPENSLCWQKFTQIFTICVVRGKFISKRDLISCNLVATIPINNQITTKIIIIILRATFEKNTQY